MAPHFQWLLACLCSTALIPSVLSQCLTSAAENSLAALCWKPISHRPGETALLSGLRALLPGLAPPLSGLRVLLPGLAPPLSGLRALLPGLAPPLSGVAALPGSGTRTETEEVTPEGT